MRNALSILFVISMVVIAVGSFVYAIHLISTSNFVLDLPMK